MADEDIPSITVRSVVVLKTGSVAMDVVAIVSGKAKCVWENLAGEGVEETHPVSKLKLYDGENAETGAL